VELLRQRCAARGSGGAAVEVEILQVALAATLDTIGHVAFATTLGQTSRLMASTTRNQSDWQESNWLDSDWLTRTPPPEEDEDVAGMLTDIAASFPAIIGAQLIGSQLPPALYRALPQRATFLQALDGFDRVIARVVRERRAAGLHPGQDMDFLGRAVQADPIKPTLKAPGTKRLKL